MDLPPPHVPQRTRLAPLPFLAIGVTAALTVAAIVVGQRDWAVPERVLRGWQVTDVPSSLTLLLILTAAMCVLLGAGTTLRDGRLRPRDPVFLAWLLLVLIGAAALVWNALVMAADAEFVVGALIPVFHWLFTFAPALLAGLAARRREARTILATALGTGAVTVPLLGLGFSLFGSREDIATGTGQALWNTLILGVAPLALAAVFARNAGRRREQLV
jgi:hypothetical protein